MSLVPLWTDYMIWGLVIAIVFWARIIGKSPEIKRQWRLVFESKVAIVSTVILLFYVFIALIDSIHFIQTAPQAFDGATETIKPQSVFDAIFSHLANESERTYSAPFALVEHNKSMQVLASGEVKYLYLPLQNIDPTASILLESIKGFFIGIGLSLLLILPHVFWRSVKNSTSFLQRLKDVWQQKTVIPWFNAYITFAIILTLFSIFYVLSFSYHVLGTDKVGGDVFYEALKSIRTGMLIGVLTTLVMLPLALILGISAGLFKGWVDDVIQYLYTTLNSIPGVLLIAAAVLVMQVMMSNNPDWFTSTEERADMRLLFLILILGVTSWTGLCRLLRAETLKISQLEFVIAAKAFGVSKFKVITQHILPNLMHIVLISVVLDFSGLVLAEAVLSYVGIGVDPTMHSWGNMINQARLEMARMPMVWWSLFSAFFFMFVLVLAANLFSDRVQTVLDPRGLSRSEK